MPSDKGGERLIINFMIGLLILGMVATVIFGYTAFSWGSFGAFLIVMYSVGLLAVLFVIMVMLLIVYGLIGIRNRLEDVEETLRKQL